MQVPKRKPDFFSIKIRFQSELLITAEISDIKPIAIDRVNVSQQVQRITNCILLT